ncbi:MAG: RDD family protein [Planctomycetota bacterium]
MAVPTTFTCSCGAKLEVPSGTQARTILCPKCQRNVPIPEAKDEAQCVPVRGEDGKDYWRLVCSCGKHVRTPAAVGQPYGRCPKCGQMLKMPGFLLAQKQAGAAAVNVALEAELKPSQDGTETVAAGVAPVEEPLTRDAAFIAAERLRPVHAGGGAPSAGAESRISAWPLAGKLARALAAFIDLTLAVALTGVVFVLARKQVLPELLLRKELVFPLLVAAGVLNDGFIHMLSGASIGKRLVVLTTRTANGAEMGLARTFLRGLLKWLLIPGWLLALVDPSERTLHDLLCNTLVLKGRAKHKH